MDTLKQSVSMSLKNIITNKLRSFLTTLGIIIGVTAVIALITIVHGVYDSVMGNFSDMGANIINISITGNDMKSTLTKEDMDNIKALKYIDGLSPNLSTNATMLYDSKNYTITLQGKSEDYFKYNKVKLVSGRELMAAEMDGDVYTCVIDRDVAQKFFLGENPLGQTIKLSGYTYTIVGVIDSGTASKAATSNSTRVGKIIVPYKNVQKMSFNGNITSLEVYINNVSYAEAITTTIKSTLKEAFSGDEDSYTVTDMSSLIETMEQTENMLMAMLGGIASISLLVGGIGIMNMMLVSVSERTKEIGLRKALGAKPDIIQAQFLIESIILSLAGGFVGVVIGLVISYIACVFMDATFEIQFYAILLGVGFSAGIGIIFGWVPARRASKLNPIDALRAD